jgi:hypothetical protein
MTTSHQLQLLQRRLLPTFVHRLIVTDFYFSTWEIFSASISDYRCKLSPRACLEIFHRFCYFADAERRFRLRSMYLLEKSSESLTWLANNNIERQRCIFRWPAVIAYISGQHGGCLCENVVLEVTVRFTMSNATVSEISFHLLLKRIVWDVWTKMFPGTTIRCSWKRHVTWNMKHFSCPVLSLEGCRISKAVHNANSEAVILW